MLKIDPKNTTLLAQKQTVLKEQIEATRANLTQLTSVQEEAYRKWQNYLKVEPQLKKITEKVEETKEELQKMKEKQKDVKTEFDKVSKAKEQYEKLSQKVKDCSNKITDLKKKEEEAQEKFKKGKMSQEQYEKITEKVKKCTIELSNLKNQQQELGNTFKNIDKIKEQYKNITSEVEKYEKKLKELQNEQKNLSQDTISTENYRTYQREIETVQRKLKDLQKEQFNFGSVVAQVIAVAGAKIQDFGKKIENVGQKISAISAVATGLIVAGTKYNADIEKYQTAFKTFLGSAEDAEKVIERIRKESETSPFKTDDLIQANQMLITTGENADDSIKTISALADAIALTGGGNDALTRMASNLQQIKNAGKATSMDIRQFAYAGIDVYGILADYTGKTTEEIKNMEITYEDLSKALQMSASEGGKYFGGQAEMADTLSGQIGKLKKSFQDLLGELTKSLYPLIQKITEKVQSLVDWFKNLDDKQKELIAQILLIVAVLGPALIIIGKITSAIGTVLMFAPQIVSAIGIIKTGLTGLFSLIMAHPVVLVITAIIAILVVLWNKCDWFREGVITIVTTIRDFIFQVAEKIGEFFTVTIPGWIDLLVNTILPNLPYYIGYAIGWILGKIFEFHMNVWNFITTKVPQIIAKVIEFVAQLPGKLWTWFLATLDKVKEWLSNWLQQVQEKIPQIINEIKSKFEELPTKMIEIGRNIVEGLWNGICGAGQWIKDKVGSFARGILDGMKEALDINSPSKVFEDEVGKYIALGVGEGFLNNIGSVTKAMQNRLNLETGKISSNLTVAGSVGSSNVAGTKNTTISVNFYPQKMTEAELDNAFRYVNKKFGLAY